jgi:hypothetical protein
LGDFDIARIERLANPLAFDLSNRMQRAKALAQRGAPLPE